MSELILLPGNTVECAWCKDPKPITETTWFMPEPGERSVRLCNFCYEEARKQVRLLRFVRIRGEFPIEAPSYKTVLQRLQLAALEDHPVPNVDTAQVALGF